MPRTRSKTIRVIPFPPLSKTRWHVCRVNSIDVLPRDRGVRVTLEHTEAAQAGRTHTNQLPQLRPAGLTHDLLMAVGIEVAPDRDIDLAEAEGSPVWVRFRPAGDDSYEPVEFRAVEKGKLNGLPT